MRQAGTEQADFGITRNIAVCPVTRGWLNLQIVRLLVVVEEIDSGIGKCATDSGS